MISEELSKEVHKFIVESFQPRFNQLAETFKSDKLWAKLKELGTELWLDTGSIEQAEVLWVREFSALTTNNTLLNKEVQTGRYDELIVKANKLLGKYQLTDEQRILEIGFILNAWHGLRLVEKLDAYVSVEEHTALADDVNMAVYYAKRYNAICPERFIVKIPLTPAGILAARKLSAEGIPINHTLGFSARQNYLMARLARPAYVNVFLGRLNSLIKDNNLGSGKYIGEKATLASQVAIRGLRQQGKSPSKQIGASFRQAEQVTDLAGIDVMTMPPAVAEQFLKLGLSPEDITDKSQAQYQPGVDSNVNWQEIRLDTLWEIPDNLVHCCDAMEQENIDEFTPADLIAFLKRYDCGDIFVEWTAEQKKISSEEGKIPKLSNWAEALKAKSIGLDSLMNLAGLMSFATDQAAMDSRIKDVLSKV